MLTCYSTVIHPHPSSDFPYGGDPGIEEVPCHLWAEETQCFHFDKCWVCPYPSFELGSGHPGGLALVIEEICMWRMVRVAFRSPVFAQDPCSTTDHWNLTAHQPLNSPVGNCGVVVSERTHLNCVIHRYSQSTSALLGSIYLYKDSASFSIQCEKCIWDVQKVCSTSVYDLLQGYRAPLASQGPLLVAV